MIKVRGKRRAALGLGRDGAQAIGKEAQRPLGGDARIELAHGAGGGVARVDEGLAALRALAIPRNLCRDFALRFSWRRSAEEFVGNLMPIRRVPRRAFG